MKERDTVPTLGRGQSAPPAMLPSALSPTILLLRSRRRRRTAPAPATQRPATSAWSARTRRNSILQRRCASEHEQKPISTASAGAWWTRWTCRPRARSRRHVTQIAAQRPQHRRFLPAQHEIGRVLCVNVRRPLPAVPLRVARPVRPSRRLTTRSGGCVCVLLYAL